MFNIGEDIHSLTDFKRRTNKLAAQLHTTKRAMVLTVNGRPAMVVQDAEAYQRLRDRLWELEARERGGKKGAPAGGNPES